jgi:dihydrolipoamide dehydrogenase
VIEVKVPDIGDFKDVEVIEVLVKPGDAVTKEQSLITLESDKATMEIPSPQAGVVRALGVKLGDKVSQGSLILQMEPGEAPTASAPKAAPAAATPKPATPAPAAAASPSTTADLECDMLVLGSGPGGYSAAFRAADLGLKTVLVERYPTLGGVCLNVGCIPSKALLHTAAIMDGAAALASHGITYGAPQIDLAKLRAFKDKVVGKLTGGLAGMAKARKVTVLQGVGRFADPHHLAVETKDGRKTVRFAHAIIAAGSQSSKLPFLPADERIVDSTGALELRVQPKKLLVIGGGIIGLEMACVYDALGSEVSVVEMTDTLMPGCDRDLVRPLEKRLKARYDAVLTGTKVAGVAAKDAGLEVTFEGKDAPAPALYDRVLCAVGRVPNGKAIRAGAAGITVDERGFISTDRQMRTNVPHIFAIGDIVGQPMRAHTATHEGKVAAEVAAGEKSAFDARVIPSVAYTDPEVAWVGLTETEAKASGRKFEKGMFPWMASGRSLALNRDEGFTKLLFDPESHRAVGGGIVGTNAGDLISEVAHAIEMGSTAADIGLTVHPHPTLSETVAFAAEAYEGTLTDLFIPKKK